MGKSMSMIMIMRYYYYYDDYDDCRRPLRFRRPLRAAQLPAALPRQAAGRDIFERAGPGPALF